MKSSAPSSPAPDKDTTLEALSHFGMALVFLIVGLLALVWNSARLASGDFADLRVIGGLHFITLGWLSLSIFGALRVFTGVALGTQGFGNKLVPWTRSFWAIGAFLLPVGLIFELSRFITIGASLIGVSLILFTIHLLPALLRSHRGGLTKWFLLIALVSLWGTYSLGYLAAMIRAEHPMLALPSGYFSAHILFAVFGWVGSTIIGVGSHLIPMFALSKETTRIPVNIALAFWCLIPLCAGFGAFYEEPFISIGWICAGIGSILWIIQVFIYLKERVRKEYDPGLMIAAGATILLGIAWILFVLTNAGLPFIGVVLIGWATIFTLGIYHRVIPFLIWFARFSRSIGKEKVPKVKDLINWKLGIATFTFSLLGSIIWGAGLLIGNEKLLYCGSIFILTSALLSFFQTRFLFHSDTIAIKETST